MVEYKDVIILCFIFFIIGGSTNYYFSQKSNDEHYDICYDDGFRDGYVYCERDYSLKADSRSRLVFYDGFEEIVYLPYDICFEEAYKIYKGASYVGEPIFKIYSNESDDVYFCYEGVK